MEDNPKVLRKLETGEAMMNRIPTGSNTIRTLRLRTRIDLFAHLDALKSAIHAWKQSQPLLRAKVVPKDDDGLYYVIDENSSANRNLDNVHILRIQSGLDDDKLNKLLIDNNLLVELVVEKCGSEVIDIEKPHELMWKLVVIEMKTERDAEFAYELIWQISHVIADGMSMSKNFIRLLDLIHRSVNSKQIETHDFGVFRGKQALFEKETLAAASAQPKDLPVIPKPDFLNPTTARLNSQQLNDNHFNGLSHDQIDFELIDLNTGSSYSTLSEMIRIAREVSNLKRKTFVVPKETLEKFYKKCKSENTKLTSALNVLAAFANFRLYTHHKSARLPASVNLVPVSLRQFRPASDLGPIQLGNCIGTLSTIIPNPMTDPSDDSEMYSKFWPLAREQSSSLESRAKNDNSKYLQRVSMRLQDLSGLMSHLTISNIGVVDLSGYECFRDGTGGFRVENMFTTVTSSPTMDKILTACFFTTIGGQLCCGLGNNSFYFDPQVADQFVKYFLEILNCVIRE